MKTKIIKAFTILLFVSLLATFVGYDAGFFNSKSISLQSSPERGALSQDNDTTAIADSIRQNGKLMTSSKSIIIDAPLPPQKEDSLQRYNEYIDSLLIVEKRKTMSSTKVRLVVTREDIIKRLADSTQNTNPR